MPSFRHEISLGRKSGAVICSVDEVGAGRRWDGSSPAPKRDHACKTTARHNCTKSRHIQRQRFEVYAIMPPFHSDVHELFASWGKQDVLASIETSHKGIIERRKLAIAYGAPGSLSRRVLASRNCQLLQQILLHRSERLIWSLGSTLLEGNVYGLALVIRGQLEATAVLGYFCRKLEFLASGQVRFEDFELSIADAVMGAKHELFSEARPPVSVLTCIEKADKYLDQHYFRSKQRILADHYNWLSEFAHPNFLSNFTAFSLDRSSGEIRLRHEAELREEDFQLPDYLDTGASLFLFLFDAFTENLSENQLEPT